MKKTKYSRTIGQFTESVACMLREYKPTLGGGENKREYFKNNNIREFFKIRDRHQTTDPEN